MVEIDNAIFRSICCYNKYMTREYFDKLSTEDKLAFVHPDDREMYNRLIK